MTEYSSDEEDRRGHNSSDLTPDDFDFDISSYTNQSNFFSRWGWQTIKQRQRWLLRPRSQLPLENKKTERHRSKTDSRNNSKVAQLVRDIATFLTRLSSLQQPQLCFRRSRKQRWVQLLLAEEEERAARSPVGSVETLLSSMFTTVATAASPAKHSSGKTTTTTSVSFHHLKMRRYWSCPRTHNPSDPVHLLSRRAVNWQNKNNRTFQCKFENKCEITKMTSLLCSLHSWEMLGWGGESVQSWQVWMIPPLPSLPPTSATDCTASCCTNCSQYCILSVLSNLDNTSTVRTAAFVRATISPLAQPTSWTDPLYYTLSYN